MKQNRSLLGSLLFIISGEVIIRLVSDDVFSVIANIIFLSILLLLLLKTIIKHKQSIIAPICLFTSVSFLFTIGGEISWIVRYYLLPVQNDPILVANFYRLFCVIFYIACNLFIRRINFKDIFVKNDTYFEHTKTKLFLMYIFAYFGAYIITNGFSSIALFSANPDEVRYASRENASLTFGNIALWMGIHGIILSYKKYFHFSVKKKFTFFVLLILFLIPIALNTSRLLIFIPFIIILCINFFEQKIVFTRKNILIVSLSLSSLLLIIALFGAYRSFGANTDADSTMWFFLNDIFPEFWGTAYTASFTNETLIDPIPFVVSGIFPSGILNYIGIDKAEHFTNIGSIIGEMWNSNYSIRISLIGELYFSSLLSQISVIIILLVTLYYLSCKLANNKCKSKYMVLIAGILISLSIPYGFSLYITIILYLSCSSLLFLLSRYIYK
ncbi:hypothetical protein [Dysgonomonas sp.]